MSRELVLIPSVFVIVATIQASFLGESGEAKKIISKAVVAHGGREKLASCLCFHARMKGKQFTPDSNREYSAEYWFEHPGRLKMVMEIDLGGKKNNVSVIINDKDLWMAINGEVRNLSATQIRGLKEIPYQYSIIGLNVLVEDPAFKLAYLGETKNNNETSLGVRVSSAGHQDFSLFFDGKSGLLVKTQMTTKDDDGKGPDNVQLFTEHEAFGGVVRPSKMTSFEDGKITREDEITSMDFPKSIGREFFKIP